MWKQHTAWSRLSMPPSQEKKRDQHTHSFVTFIWPLLLRALLNWIKFANWSPVQPHRLQLSPEIKNVNQESSFVKFNTFNQVCQAWGKYPLLWLRFCWFSLPPQPFTKPCSPHCKCLSWAKRGAGADLAPFCFKWKGELNCNHTPPHLWHTPDTR